MANKKAAHATQSFAQLAAKANQDALKPVIQQMVWEALNPVLRMIEQRLMQDKEMLQIRQIATENVLEMGTTPAMFKPALMVEIANVEDRAQGLTQVEGPVLQGDKVRFDLRTEKDGVWLEPAKMAIQQVNIANEKGEYQTLTELESQLVGLAVDVETEMNVRQGEEIIKCKVTIRRISRKVA